MPKTPEKPVESSKAEPIKPIQPTPAPPEPIEEGKWKKRKIQSILNVFETGTPDGDYSNVSRFKDGPGGVRQITYGRSQTTQHSHLQELMTDYINANGQYADLFKGLNFKDFSLANDDNLVANLRKAGEDPVMHKVQDELFDRRYWNRAVEWAEKNGFKSQLGMLIIYDSFIHSGGILSFLRKRFAAVPPAKGGDEKTWLRQYLDTRHSWLANHSVPILRKTIYRTRSMNHALVIGDWNLEEPFNANGVLVK